jgi:predicted phosphodiesterase
MTTRRFALISDIHGNLTALETVLADIERQRAAGPLEVICLGDVATLGPQPLRVLRRLQALGCACVLGNHEVLLLDIDGDPNVPAWLMEQARWTLAQLSEADLEYLRTFQPTLQFPLEDDPQGESLLCCHGSPNSAFETLESTTSEPELDRLLADSVFAPEAAVRLLACGHSHAQMLRLYRGCTLLNPGSVGYTIRHPWQPGQEARLQPWAEYAFVQAQSGPDGRLSLGIELRQVALDMPAVFQSVRSSSMPGLDRWLARWLV